LPGNEDLLGQPIESRAVAAGGSACRPRIFGIGASFLWRGIWKRFHMFTADDPGTGALARTVVGTHSRGHLDRFPTDFLIAFVIGLGVGPGSFAARTFAAHRISQRCSSFAMKPAADAPQQSLHRTDPVSWAKSWYPIGRRDTLTAGTIRVLNRCPGHIYSGRLKWTGIASKETGSR
jgi:hypothetical protein